MLGRGGILKFSFALVFFFTLLALAAPAPVSARDKYITIGTGGVTGVYYPAGGAICRLVNRGRKDHGIRCSVESTSGSVFNLEALQSGDIDIAAAQSDLQYHAYNGTGPFQQVGPYKGLCSLFSMHSEPFTVIVRTDAGINKFDDIKGKKVNVGNPGSGMRATMDTIMEKKGWTKNDFALAAELKSSEQAQALCDGQIDVMIYSAGHPNGAVQEVTSSCPTKIINVEGPEIDQLIKENPFYAYATVPGKMYKGTPEDVRTFGVKATFVTSEDVDEEIIYNVVKSVFSNFDNFRTLHPVFSSLEAERMIREGNTAPLHKGAERYFREAGLLGAAAPADANNAADNDAGYKAKPDASAPNNDNVENPATPAEGAH